ncbi:hypothetical protein GGQ54_001207 [Naumannella cuiyingiana]|uniref:Uncharacterized protein n=1 Tax=Naumannella cuiyingiana TaxID=1347891 RepID=A0A7Z0D843_9ACTN|nr:hypothetical protein [Naumannella cuiyingiana]
MPAALADPVRLTIVRELSRLLSAILGVTLGKRVDD